MNLNVPLLPSYTREVWDYNKAVKKMSREVLKPATWQDFS